MLSRLLLVRHVLIITCHHKSSFRVICTKIILYIKRAGMLTGKFELIPLKETNLGVTQASLAPKKIPL